MYKLILVVVLSTVIFVSCEEQLSTNLSEKKFSFEDIKDKINSGKVKGYISADSNKLFFIQGDDYSFEGQYGYVFALKKGDKNIPAGNCYQKINRVIKVSSYKNVILALEGNSPNGMSDSSLYMVDEQGNYKEVGYGVTDFEVVGDNIYEVSGRDILVYQGGKDTKVTFEPVKGEGAATTDCFRESGKTIIIYDQLLRGSTELYPMSFKKTKIDEKEILTVHCTDGTTRVVPTNLEGLMEVVVTKIRKEKGNENKTSFTSDELTWTSQNLKIKDLKIVTDNRVAVDTESEMTYAQFKATLKEVTEKKGLRGLKDLLESTRARISPRLEMK